MEVNYFPYLNMSDIDEIQFPDLGVTVWNYQKKADEYVTNPQTRKQLDLIINANVERWHGVNNVGVISLGKTDWREYSREEQELCREVRLILFMMVVASTGVLERGPNTGHYQYTTENFVLVTQKFSKTNERMGIEAGYIVRKSDYGFKLSEIKFQKPDHVPGPLQFRSDKTILHNLLYLRKYQKKMYRRVLTSIEALSQAYVNDTSLSSQSRIPILASSYEALFDLPEQRQRAVLKEYFRDHIAPTGRTFRYSSARPGGFVWETEDISVMWVDKFYTLRNKIIHGNNMKQSELVFRGKQTHFDIAVIFFVFGLKTIIGELPKVSATKDEVHWSVQRRPEEDEYEGFVYSYLDMFRGMKL